MIAKILQAKEKATEYWKNNKPKKNIRLTYRILRDRAEGGRKKVNVLRNHIERKKRRIARIQNQVRHILSKGKKP